MVEFGEVKYGMLMMVLCDREGRIYDVWITFGSVHEVRAFRERMKRSLWFRGLVEICVVYGDRGYRGCEGVIVCDSKDMRSNLQSYCYLVVPEEIKAYSEAIKRLRVLVRSNDGFEIAEEDLRIRGHSRLSGYVRKVHFVSIPV